MKREDEVLNPCKIDTGMVFISLPDKQNPAMTKILCTIIPLGQISRYILCERVQSTQATGVLEIRSDECPMASRLRCRMTQVLDDNGAIEELDLHRQLLRTLVQGELEIFPNIVE